MASTEDPLTVRELVLLIIDAAGGELKGRTAAQKLAYFGAQVLGEDAGHRAHFYGPFSRPVDNALSNSAYSGDLDEVVRTFWSSSGEGREYEYRLTDQGREMVDELRASHPEASGLLDANVGRLGELVPGYRQYPLSLAAKVDLIVGQQEGGRAEQDDIPKLAERLGWNMSDDDVKQAVEILVGLGRVETSD